MRSRLKLCMVLLLNLWQSSAEARTELDWWETTVVYQIYPRSFKDSNGDGNGDINGIYEKLDYIKDIGVEVIWIQPIYNSPMADMGYDPISLKEIHPMFGTMEDVKNLIKGAHDRGLKIMMDFVANHVSDQSEWFKLSENRVEPYTDYFIWHDGKRINATHRTEPNNWVAQFADSAWKWSEIRKQYYFFQFDDKQPDLNYHNPNVRKEMEELLKFWLELGVDGFRVDASGYMVEAAHLRDEPVITCDKCYHWLTRDHIYTLHQPENLIILHRWREIMDEYKKKDNRTRLLCVEDVHSADILLPYFGNDSYPLVHIPFYFGLVWLDYEQNVTVMDDYIHNWVDIMPSGRLPNWVVDTHDLLRASSRFGTDSADALNMVNLLLPGSSSVYYGAEIGLDDSVVRTDQIRDSFHGDERHPFSRDPSRGPMIWDDTKNAGFTTNDKSWLPVHCSYWRKNVKKQLEEPMSHLKIFKRLIALKKTATIKYGDLKTLVLSPWTYVFTRNTTDETIAVIVNLGTELEKICSENFKLLGLSDMMVVHTASLNSGFNTGDKVKLAGVDGHCAELRPKAGLVLTSNSGILWNCSTFLTLFAVGVHFFWRTG